MPNDAVELRADHGRRGAGVIRWSRAGGDGLVVCALGQLGARSVRRVGAMRARDQGVLWGAALAPQGGPECSSLSSLPVGRALDWR